MDVYCWLEERVGGGAAVYEILEIFCKEMAGKRRALPHLGVKFY